jgi:hypothetical protein
MESSHTAELDIPELNAAASKALVFPGMASHSLLSVRQLFNDGYIVTFKHASVTICDSKKSQILNGPRDLDTGLWRINLKQTNNHIPKPVANNVYELRNTGALVHYLHKTLFSPTKYALLQAVKDGHLITWPGLTRRYQQTFETHAGHVHGPYGPATPKHKVHLESTDFGPTITGHRLGHKNPHRVCRRG